MNFIAASAALCSLVACTEIPSGANTVASIQFDSLPSPSVVLGDTLRDASGKISPVMAKAFAYGGSPVANAPFRYFALDRGLTVDSVTGRVTGDSLRATAARVVAATSGLQAILSIPVVPRPDTVVVTHGRDSLAYSLADSALNVSPALSLALRHTLDRPDSVVSSYLVAFAITNQADSLAAQIVSESGSFSPLDTTDASGTASRQVRVRPARLRNVNDSVIVTATVRYRGSQVRGSPARLVIRLRPR